MLPTRLLRTTTQISRKEFRAAMPALGFDVAKEQIDELFDANDPDGLGRTDEPEPEP